MPDLSLEAIDTQLIHLLSQRIEILSGRSPSSSASSATVDPELQKAGVPPFVWNSLVTSCTAALATRPLRLPEEPQRCITLIGGRGMMAQFFRQRLQAAGHEVRLLGRQDWPQAQDLLQGIDLALVCVPIDRTLEIIRQTAAYLPPTATLADITSIKGPMVETMLAVHPGPVVGLHPMFGPGVESFLSQKVVICPGRDRPAWQWLVDLMARDGGDLVESPPEEHDQMMVTVQAIRHFATFGLGVFLAQDGIEVGRSLDLSSPIYRLGIDMVSRLFGQDAELYADIMLANADRREAIARLAQTFQALAEQVQAKDRQGLIDAMNAASETFGSETERAVRESDRLIEAMSILLAADRVIDSPASVSPPPDME